MTASVLDRSALGALIVDSLEEQIAVIDADGTIVEVNRAWTQFGVDNGLAGDSAGTGRNYLQVLRDAAAAGDELAREAARGIDDVIAGVRHVFRIEYPCHGPDQKRWFEMCACALRGGPVEMFVVSHHDIGRRKLAEERAARLGGDEFALILGNTDLAGAGRIAHGVRHDVAELRIALRGGRMLSISAGYAAVVPGAGQFEDGLLHEADKALYAAKASGGSRERAYARF